MGVASKVLEFKSREEKPTLRFFRDAAAFRSLSVEAYQRLLQGPAGVNIELHDQTGRISIWENFFEFYTKVLRPWKKAAAEHGLYLDFLNREGTSITGNIVHKASLNGMPVVFVTDTEPVLKERSLLRVIGEIGACAEMTIFCDRFISDAVRQRQFFSTGTADGYPTLNDPSLVTRENFDVDRIARSISDSVDPKMKMVFAVVAALERREYVPDVNRIADMEMAADIYGKLAVLFFSIKAANSGIYKPANDFVEFAGAIKYSERPLTWLGKLLIEHAKGNPEVAEAINFMSKVIEQHLGVGGVPVSGQDMIKAYSVFSQGAIKQVFSTLLDGISINQFRVPWNGVQDKRAVESVSRVFNDVPILV